MAVLPSTRLEKLEFVEAHITPWTSGAVSIGLTAGQMSSLSTQTTASRAAYNAMLAAQQASKNATQFWYNTCQTMVDTTADYLKTIKAFAATTNNPNVFTIAQIPPPKTPSASPPPATPTGLAATLLNNGAVRLSWTAKVGDGMAFEVWRRLGNQSAFSLVGVASASKTFDDTTLPVGVSSASGVLYRVRATKLGMFSDFSEPINVQFGVEGGGDGVGGEGSQGLQIAA